RHKGHTVVALLVPFVVSVATYEHPLPEGRRRRETRDGAGSHRRPRCRVSRTGCRPGVDKPEKPVALTRCDAASHGRGYTRLLRIQGVHCRWRQSQIPLLPLFRRKHRSTRDDRSRCAWSKTDRSGDGTRNATFVAAGHKSSNPVWRGVAGAESVTRNGLGSRV